MKKSVYDFVRIASECFTVPEPIIEFGARRDPSQTKIGDIRDLFPHNVYLKTDSSPGFGVQEVLDCTAIMRSDESVGLSLRWHRGNPAHELGK